MLRNRRSTDDVVVANGATAGVQRPRNGSRPVRVFKVQDSLTDQLVSTDANFQAIYDAVMIQVLLFIVYVIIRDSYKAGRLHLDVTLMYIGLGSLQTIGICVCVWVSLLSCACLVHPSFLVWRRLRTTCPPMAIDVSFILLYGACVLGSGAVVCWLIFHVPFPPYTAAIISVEQLRFAMKSYSFIRENAYKVIYPWNKKDTSGPAVWYGGQMQPETGLFTQYLYFLFSPTLLYRDNYPRSPEHINIKNVTIYFLHFLLTIWYISVLVRDFLFPTSMHLSDLVHSFLINLLCAFLMLLLVHTCVLHCYLNFVCEVLRFGDREFYNDWWACTSFATYYRKWNRLVYDWIHCYLYTDMKTLFGKPLPALFATILTSAFVHEYVIAVTVQFASPVLILEFAGLGGVFYLMRPLGAKRVSHLLVILALSVGGAILLFYYQVEFAARLHCPKKLSMTTFFLPRMFECIRQFNS